GALWLLTFACCARRLWPRGNWFVLGLGLLAVSPLAIWTARTPLSEAAMAMFEWAAVLAALRLRDGIDEARGPWLAAGMLALAAGVRGNALVVFPVVLALLWLRPREGRARHAPLLLLAGLVLSTMFHAATSYPYLHDELLRRLPTLHWGPGALMAATVLGALGWWLADRLLASIDARRHARALALVPRLLLLLLVLAFGLWWWLRSGVALDEPPFARLDAAPILIGWPLLATAAAGSLVVVRRWRAHPREVWLLALLAVVPATALLYAPRELPRLSFFYYGRYLVPELLPCAILAATAGLHALGSAIAGSAPGKARASLGIAVPGALALVLLGWTAWPLVREPQLRLREYEPAGQAIDWLAARIEPGA
ncbi:MAG: hypothetical protein KC431_17325, partial [Myxococcales bacterium]|nr:hypothetical protein [Myxococcales bacterium]